MENLLKFYEKEIILMHKAKNNNNKVIGYGAISSFAHAFIYGIVTKLAQVRCIALRQFLEK